MKKSLERCPACNTYLEVTEYTCPRCRTKISGRFEQSKSELKLPKGFMNVLKLFITSYGNIGEVAKYLGVSRPTARIRIEQLGKALGITMRDREKTDALEILEYLDRGELNVDEALDKIKDLE